MSDRRAGFVASRDLPKCDAIGCEAFADWFYKDQFGTVLLCVFHGGKEPVEGWEWIGE